jgi:hypothetical protein
MVCHQIRDDGLRMAKKRRGYVRTTVIVILVTVV